MMTIVIVITVLLNLYINAKPSHRHCRTYGQLNKMRREGACIVFLNFVTIKEILVGLFKTVAIIYSKYPWYIGRL